MGSPRGVTNRGAEASSRRSPTFGPTDFRYAPPISPCASFSLSRHFVEMGREGPLHGMRRHVACACMILRFCRSSRGIYYLLQAQNPVSFDTHVQEFPLQLRYYNTLILGPHSLSLLHPEALAKRTATQICQKPRTYFTCSCPGLLCPIVMWW